MNKKSRTDSLRRELSSLGADTVLFNANVVTMNPVQPRAEAIAVKDGRIIGVGRNGEIESCCGPKTEKIDFKGKTVIPGFIESHNHMGMYAAFIKEIACGYDKNKCIDDILAKVKKRAGEIPPGEWIMGWGYNDVLMADKRHVNRYDLDQVAPDHPVCLTHYSGHLVAVNSKALELAGIDKNTPDPDGGKIFRDPSTGEPTGVLAEMAGFAIIKLMTPKSVDDLVAGLKLANREYVENGVTSIHDALVGFQNPNEITAYFKAVEDKAISVRVQAFLSHDLLTGCLKEGEQLNNLGIARGCGDERFKIGAVKIVQDGSLPGMTGAVIDPYLCNPAERGILLYSQEELTETVINFHKAGWQIAIHGNADRGIESALQALESALNVLPRDNHRHRIEHCQLAHEDQLQRMAKAGIGASFHITHVNFWGDHHRDMFFGPARASRIDPLKSALDHGVIFGLHTDCPVLPIAPIKGCLYPAVARETMTGKILGPEQAISVDEALKALTINAAYLGFEENIKGSIEVGKLADFVSLSEDPYLVAPTDLKDVQVEMTMIGGEVVYQKG